MGKGAKIAIGCFAVLLVGAIGVGVAIIGAGYWAKSKVEKLTGAASELGKYEKEANSHPFTVPADGAFTEDRLLKFLEVRKQVYAVYQAHNGEIEAAKAKKQADLGDAMKFASLVAEVKMTQEKAQASVGMSDGEYIFMVRSLYGAAIQSQVQKETGKTMGQNVDEMVDQSKKALENVPQATGGQVSDKTIADAEAQARDAGRQLMSAMNVPQSNIDLYRRHEAEIKRYSMEGLAFIGL